MPAVRPVSHLSRTLLCKQHHYWCGRSSASLGLSCVRPVPCCVRGMSRRSRQKNTLSQHHPWKTLSQHKIFCRDTRRPCRYPSLTQSQALLPTQNFCCDIGPNNLCRDRELSIATEEPWVVCRDRDSLSRQSSSLSRSRVLGYAWDPGRAHALLAYRTLCCASWCCPLCHTVATQVLCRSKSTMSRHKASRHCPHPVAT